jgi:hypothetical protein
LALQAPVFAVIKSAKAGPCPFPKQGEVDTYPSHPMALPGLPSQEASRRDRSAPNRRWPVHFRSGFSKAVQRFNAGWSSPVARQAHNLKVIGSNPIPATKYEAPAILIDCRGFLLSLRSCPPPQVRSGLLSRSQRSDRRTGIQSSAPSRSQFQSRPPIDVEEENPKRTGYVRSLRRFAGCHANNSSITPRQGGPTDTKQAIRPEGAKQQGGFVRCVSASRPGGVRLQLHATSRLRPSELFPVPALLRCHCIPNSIVYEVRAGRKK